MPKTTRNASVFDHALASELAAIRQRLGIPQTALAAELGVDQTTISRVEQGSRKLSAFEAMSWLEALGLTPSESSTLLEEIWSINCARPKGFWNG